MSSHIYPAFTTSELSSETLWRAGPNSITSAPVQRYTGDFRSGRKVGLLLSRFSSYCTRNLVPLEYIIIIVREKHRTPSPAFSVAELSGTSGKSPPQPCFGRVRFTVLVSLSETGRLSVTFAFALNNRVGLVSFYCVISGVRRAHV